MSKVCDFNQLNKVNAVPILATFNNVVGIRLLQLNNSVVISAILAYKVDSIDLLLISYTQNNEHFLAKVKSMQLIYIYIYIYIIGLLYF